MRWCGLVMTTAVVSSRLPVTRSKRHLHSSRRGGDARLSSARCCMAWARQWGKPARLIPGPAGMLQFGPTLLGKKAMAQRLLGSLQVDISKTCELLEWAPPYTVQEGLRRCFERSN